MASKDITVKGIEKHDAPETEDNGPCVRLLVFPC